MNNNDLRKLRVVIKEEVTTVVKKEISASEKKLMGEIGKTEQRLLGEMGKFVEEELLPAIEKKADKTDIDRLENNGWI